VLAQVQAFLIEPLGTEAARSRVISNGDSVAEVAGCLDEMQFTCSHGYLLITSDGNPYEEELHFSLLAPSREILDGFSLGQIYHSGIFSNIEIVGDTIEFSFFGAERWCLTVLDAPRSRVPLNRYATVHGALGNWRRGFLSLTRIENHA
jgi:hypothetical protein